MTNNIHGTDGLTEGWIDGSKDGWMEGRTNSGGIIISVIMLKKNSVGLPFILLRIFFVVLCASC